MRRKLTVISWIVILVATTIISVSVLAQNQPQRPTQGQSQKPPAEAIAACKGKKLNTSCRINTPQGTVTGTCTTIQNQLACTPQGGPPR
jgi:hypothetical protein